MESKQETVSGKNGEDKEIGFLSLTPFGNAELIRIRAIYREPPDNDANER